MELKYTTLVEQALSLTDGEFDVIANLANVSALIMDSIDQLNWAGFYLVRDGELVLGPFQGKPACIRISCGRGVCGTAMMKKVPVLVPDVHAFPGHIACDGNSRSELVVPLIVQDQVVAVMDLDSPVINRFTEAEQECMEQIAARLSDICDWGRII